MTSISADHYSRYARQIIAADPSLAQELELAPVRPWTRAEMSAFVCADPSPDSAALGARLRRLRRRVMLRCIARDLAGLATLDEVCTVMTTLAETALEFAQADAERQMRARFGIPEGAGGSAQRLIIVGMGKLGGGELNVSSDIDLIFVYPEDGETRDGPRSLSNHEYFSSLGRAVIATLAEPTAEGYVFRVDMRLRPWGNPGPLAMSFDALEEYFVTQGREWERYAWIKARALTGDAHAELAAISRPFVFRKYLDYGAIAAMRDLHAQVRDEVARRDLADHVKLGPGGIREIEFIAQAYQLIRGGRDADLRQKPTLTILAALAQKGILEDAAAKALSCAYEFLRKVEHRLQYLDDAQTHSLPTDEADRRQLALAMGFRGWKSFLKALDKHRQFVSAHFEQVFATQESPRHSLAPLWSNSREHLVELRKLGFRDPESIAENLSQLRGSGRYEALPEASRLRFDALMPRIIEAASTCANPDETLQRCTDLLETISRRAAYLALLDEHPQALARLAQLAGGSPWAAEYLRQHPIVLDELLDVRALQSESNWSAFGRLLRRQLADHSGDTERQIDLLREAHQAQVFRLLAKDMGGTLSVEQLADELSDLADVMLQVTLETCWVNLHHRHLPFPRFAIIGYGKLGGKELGYASDLDIVFLHDDEDDQAPEIYTRFAQRLNNWLTLRSGAGVLFETDLRLRPDGDSGLLVSSVEAFRKYQREAAWTWEHQALTRARFCAGDATVGAAFEAERRQILGMKRDSAKLREEILEMRQKLLEGHPNRSDLFDIKHDRGGMIDIEFMVQYLVLANSHDFPSLQANDGNIALLQAAASHGLIPVQDAQNIRAAYRAFRRRQHALRLAGERYARVPAKELESHVNATMTLWKRLFG